MAFSIRNFLEIQTFGGFLTDCWDFAFWTLSEVPRKGRKPRVQFAARGSHGLDEFRILRGGEPDFRVGRQQPAVSVE